MSQSSVLSSKVTAKAADAVSKNESKASNPSTKPVAPDTIRALAKFAVAVLILGIIALSVWHVMIPSSAVNAGTVFEKTATSYRFYDNKPDFSGEVAVAADGEPVTLAEDAFHADLPLSLTFVIETFDPSSGIVNGTVSASITTYQHPNLQPEDIPKIIYVDGQPLKLGLPPDRGIGPLIWSGSAPFTVQAQGSSSSFPSDSYAISDSIFLKEGGDSPSGAADVSLQAGPKMYPYTIKAHKTDNTWELSVILHRNAREAVWCYVIALAPILLILAMIWQLITRSPGVTIEAGIGILAILPLRQVLVPSDVGALTRIDLILGMELLAIIALVAIGSLGKIKPISNSTSTSD